MDLFSLQNLLDKIRGCTFATMDTRTEPSNGIHKITTGNRVLLFTNKKSNGYKNMVKRRLVEAGKNPANFVLGDLAWGERLPNSPLIIHKDEYYLQCILLAEGQSRYFIGSRETSGAMFKQDGPSTNQGLPPSSEVKVRTYKLSSIDRIALMDDVLIANRGGDIIPASGT